ncbi:MAG: hypothetical protein JO336_05510 [Acidobacteriia bacterium]|nr:hypothetical protein [Terriglobia bacterium]
MRRGLRTARLRQNGRVLDIEGNPESPINEGTLCPKGANTFQLAQNSHRITTALYRNCLRRGLDAAHDRSADHPRPREFCNFC